jgi:ATP-dependent Clp protease adaptor protein ClpS
MSASTTLDRQTSSEVKRKPSPRYKVLLHDDPVNTIEFVIVTIMKVMGYGQERATQITLEVHNSGSSVVTVCDIEPAEHYCECFKSKGLTSSIEEDK